jgi:hypothetical protein
MGIVRIGGSAQKDLRVQKRSGVVSPFPQAWLTLGRAFRCLPVRDRIGRPQDDTKEEMLPY